MQAAFLFSFFPNMKCFNHVESDAVAQCGNCWINICKQCYSWYTSFNKVICKYCHNKLNKAARADENQIKKDLVLVIWWWCFIFIAVLLMNMFGIDYFRSYLNHGYYGYYIVKGYNAMWNVWIWFLIFKTWKYIPSISQYMPIFFWNIFFVFIMNIIMFMISIIWWMIYVIFIFPISYGKYLSKWYWTINLAIYLPMTILIYFLIAIIISLSYYYKLI